MRGVYRSIPGEDGRPFQQVVAIDNPAAGVDVLQALDPRYSQWLLSLVFTLTTSAVAGNRYVTVEYLDGTNTAFCVNAAGVAVLAGSTQRFAGSSERGEGEWATGTDVLFPLMPLQLEGGHTLSINVANMDVADTLTGIRAAFWRVYT